jgi:hypothetical protein
VSDENSFVVRLKDGKYCPWIVCGHCGEPIENLEATVAWIQTKEFEDGTVHRVTVLCKKNGCTAGILKPGVHSQSLRPYLSGLIQNLEPRMTMASGR